MEGLNDSGQWIVLMGILVSIGLFFLAFVINQSALVGQTTAEGVLEFPKNEIQDTRSEIFRWSSSIMKVPLEVKKNTEKENALRDMTTLGRYRRNAEIWFDIDYYDLANKTVEARYYFIPIRIHYNNGVTVYDDKRSYFISKI